MSTIKTIQVTDEGDILINGIKYVPHDDVTDPEYIKEMEQDISSLQDHITAIQGGWIEREAILIKEIQTIKELINRDMGSPTSSVSPESGFTINDLLDDLRHEEDRQHEKIIVRTGSYHEALNLSDIQDLTLVFEDVEINGLRKAEWEWTVSDGVYVGVWPGYDDLWHWKDDDSRGDFNSTKMYPVLAMIGDEPLVWHSSLESLQASGEGFYMSMEPNEAGTIYVKLKEGQKIDDFQFSPFPRLFYGDPDTTKNITIEGNVTFKGCSNTGKTGAVNFPGSGWDTTKATISVSHVNTIGIEFGQGGERSNMKSHVIDSKFGVLRSHMAGQMGFWGKAERCTAKHLKHEKSNWKGFSYWWEASQKFEGCKDFFIEILEADDCNGQGWWFDIHNHNITVLKLIANKVLLAGLMVEHHASNVRVYEIDIDGVSSKVFDPETPWPVSAGILIQSNIFDCKFGGDDEREGYIIVKNAEDAIRINNTDTRGNSDRNTFKNLSHENVTDPPVRVLGDMAGNKVEYA